MRSQTGLTRDCALASQQRHQPCPGVALAGAVLVRQSRGSGAGRGSANPEAAFGVVLLSEAKAQFGTCYGQNLIQSNQGGGFFLQENSELSLWNCGSASQTLVLSNGPVGISAGLGSQVTLFKNAQVSGHTEAGVEVYGHSQLNINGNNLISANGTVGDPRSAGIVVDGSSEAYLRGGSISSNQGPAILELANSSSDFTGAAFADNSGGIIHCDSSSIMVSDLRTRGAEPTGSIDCRTPHGIENHHERNIAAPAIPDASVLKIRHAQYMKVASRKPR